jgi:hypothetical protein
MVVVVAVVATAPNSARCGGGGGVVGVGVAASGVPNPVARSPSPFCICAPCDGKLCYGGSRSLSTPERHPTASFGTTAQRQTQIEKGGRERGGGGLMQGSTDLKYMHLDRDFKPFQIDVTKLAE